MDPAEDFRKQLRSLPDPAALLEDFFFLAPVALELYDAQGHTLLTNPAFRELFGSVPPPGYNVLRDEQAAAQGVLPFIQRAFAGEVVCTPPVWYDPREVRHVEVKEGRRVAIGSHMFPMRDAGGRVAFVGMVFREVSAELGARETAEHAAAAAEHERAELAAILEHLPAGVLIARAPSGELVRANPRFEQILGHPFLAARGIDEYGRYAAEHADGRPYLPSEHPLARSLQGCLITGEDVIYRRPDGSRRVLSVSSTPVRDGRGAVEAAVMSFVDITELKEVESKLRASEERFRAVFDNAGIGIVVGDLAGNVERTNPALQRILGYAPEEIQELGVGGVTHPDDSSTDRAQFARLVSGATDQYRVEKRYIRKDGQTVWGRLVVSLGREADGRPQFAIGMLEDVTAHKTAELESDRLLEDLRAAVLARDEFLSTASHELRTPLTTLGLRVETILDELAPAEGGEHVATELRSVLKQVARLERLVDGLLDVSRITTGRFHLEPEDTDFASLVRDVVARLTQEAGRAGSSIALSAPEALRGSWDPLRLDQITTNLLANAIKYGRGRPIEVRLEAAGAARARLVVEDHGIGIALRDQERIFRRFERAASARHYGGLGIGLWVVHQIVEAMGGEIHVESAPHQGSTFTVELPLS